MFRDVWFGGHIGCTIGTVWLIDSYPIPIRKFVWICVLWGHCKECINVHNVQIEWTLLTIRNITFTKSAWYCEKLWSSLTIFMMIIFPLLMYLCFHFTKQRFHVLWTHATFFSFYITFFSWAFKRTACIQVPAQRAETSGKDLFTL